MASIITATTTSGLTQSADNSGVLQLASGTGNLVTIPSVTGTAMVSGNMPAFSAVITSSSQSISPNTYVKVQLGTELFDTNNNFDSTTNYRFTPTLAGYYQINASIAISWSTTTPTGGQGALYKNGSVFYITSFRNDSGNPMYGSCNITTLVYMNGTTDYLELFGYAVGGTGTVFNGTSGQNIQTWMNGYLARTA
jgi:hypothetical protein